MKINNGPALLVAVMMLISPPLFAEQMSIGKQIHLSPGHPVVPSHITRASNGDLLIFGSNADLGFRPWAIRLTSAGEVRWEFLQGAADGWNDRKERGQRFDSAVELSDQTTLLCGLQVVNYERSVLLDRIGMDGRLIDERVIHPDKRQLVGVNCVRWNDGLALIGGVAGDPSGTGWLVKLDDKMNPEWQKFGDEYIATEGDVMSAPAGGFLYLNPSQQDAKGRRASTLFRMSATGAIVARHVFDADDNPTMVYPAVPRSDLYVALAVDTLKTDVIHLDDQLRGPTRVIELHNAGIKKCLELPDGSIAIFGSQFHNIASAAVTRVYKDGTSKGFLVEGAIGSPWYFDAVLTNNPNVSEFAAVRISNVTDAVVDWISFK
jgi:hypothetical protein